MDVTSTACRASTAKALGNGPQREPISVSSFTTIVDALNVSVSA
jgi:hypothetical protein